MVATLRQVVYQFHASEKPGVAKLPRERRGGYERRASDRRRNLFSLESRDSRLRFAAQAAGFGTYYLDCATGDSLWSPELKGIAGLPLDNASLSTEEAESLIHLDDRRAFLDKLQASLDPEGNGGFEHEHRIVRPDGTIRWVKTKGQTFFVGDPEARYPLAATGIVMDITASRIAEQELIESHEDLDRLLDSAIDGVITIDADQRIVRFNPSAARIFRCRPQDAIGSPLERFIPERFRVPHQKHVAAFLDGGITARPMGQSGLFAGLRADGEEFPIEASIAKVQVGDRRRMTVFLRDVTDLVRARESFRHSMEDLELALQTGYIGIWSWDTRTGEVEWSERQYLLFGIPDGELLTYDRFLAAVHPEDREAVLSAGRRTMENGEEYIVEYRVVWPDGSIHWIAGRGRFIDGPNGGGFTILQGVNIDITPRKLREEALAQRTEELQAVLDAIPAAVLLCNDSQCRDIRCNPAGNRIFSTQPGDNVSYSAALPERAVDYKVFDAAGRELAPSELAMQYAATQGQAIRDAEYRLQFHGGRDVWLYGHATPLFTHDGSVRGVVAVFSDITERKQAEQRIQTSEARFHSTFEQMAVGLAHVSLEGRLLRVNAKYSAIVGYDRDALEHMSVQEITHPDDLEAEQDIIAQLLAGRVTGYTMEKRYIRKDGTVIWCNRTVSLVRNAAGEPDYLVSVLEDIQARKEAERALAEERESRQRMLARQVAERTAEVAHSNEALMRSNMELSNFAHVAAHDLQTPLRSIAGFAQLLQQSAGRKLTGEEIQWIGLIVNNTKRLQKLIHELLAYSRLEAQARPYEMTNFQELCSQAITVLNGPIKESDATVTCSGLPTLPVDRIQVTQLFQNLIENALKYRSGEPPRVAISGERQGDEWIFSVADNGIGIDPKHHKRIFEIFRRLHSYNEIPGSGIGLAICQRIATRHGGRMWVESQKGKGSIFRFSLPAKG